jgi:cob(I)alamin adenosyltransferase
VFNEEQIGADAPAEAPRRRLDAVLRKVQNQLFDLGSELATPPDAVYEGMFRVGEGEVTELESIMDECQKDLEPLKSFILPGGGRVHGFLHQARTVCRRAERDLLALSRVEPVSEWTLRYLNRLSDLFFVLGRWAGKQAGEREYLWERGLSAHTRRRG